MQFRMKYHSLVCYSLTFLFKLFYFTLCDLGNNSIHNMASLTYFVLIFVSVTTVRLSNAGLQFLEVPKDFISAADDFVEAFVEDALLPSSSRSVDNVTIQYQLFTPDNPRNACISDSTVNCLRPCRLSPNYETKIIVHGYTTQLEPGNKFELIKDALLETNPYNVIVVNWTLYNHSPYSRAVDNALIVGRKMADTLNCVEKEFERIHGKRLEGLHFIGHSLGAHAAGYAGSLLRYKATRISGLDPAGPLFELPGLLRNHRLSYNDAQFVDVIHTSNVLTFNGYGLGKAIGHMDFYPNGGKMQPMCEKGSVYYDNVNDMKTVTSVEDVAVCNHSSAVIYFLESIRRDGCRFVSFLCNSYSDFKKELCSLVTAEMGLWNERNPSLPTLSEFFLMTSDDERTLC